MLSNRKSRIEDQQFNQRSQIKNQKTPGKESVGDLISTSPQSSQRTQSVILLAIFAVSAASWVAWVE
jgi:hypothetical protein